MYIVVNKHVILPDDLPKKVLEVFIKLVNNNLVKFCSETEELANIIKMSLKFVLLAILSAQALRIVD